MGVWMCDSEQVTGEVLIKADNQAAIKLLGNPITSERSKHISVLHHYARDRVALGEVRFEYIPTKQMVADCLTKALMPAQLTACSEGMGLI
jgi:hypothetical protein